MFFKYIGLNNNIIVFFPLISGIKTHLDINNAVGTSTILEETESFLHNEI